MLSCIWITGGGATDLLLRDDFERDPTYRVHKPVWLFVPDIYTCGISLRDSILDFSMGRGYLGGRGVVAAAGEELSLIQI